MIVHDKVEIVSIGAGWTAGILAWKLCSDGHRMVSIEQGPARGTTPDFAWNHDDLRYEIRNAMMVDLKQETWTWRPNPAAPSLPIRQYGSFHPGRGTGGSSVHWTAQYWRFDNADFRHRSHNEERYGPDRIPENMTIQDWPVTYEELEPFYDAVDYDLGISGQAGNVNGEIIPGGNPFEEPRSRPYPLPPHPMSLSADLFAEAATALGYAPFPQPAGIVSQAFEDPFGNHHAGCIYCGYCTRFGCEVDAKMSGINTHIPAALNTGRYDIRTNCKVLRVNVGPDGLATGVTYIDLLTGELHEQPADLVLLTGYTLNNVRMLLLSTDDAHHTNGIGNDRGMVGKNYTYQLSKGPSSGVFNGRRFNQFMGNGVIQSVIYDFYGDNFDHADLGFIGGAGISCGSGQRQPLTSALGLMPLTAGTPNAKSSSGSGGPNPATADEISSLAGYGSEWGQDWKKNLRENWDSVVGIGVQGEIQAYDDQFLDLDPTYKDPWGLPLLRLTFDFHDNERNLYQYLAMKCEEIMKQMGADRIKTTDELDPYDIYSYQSTHCTGGAIMGTDPGNSVTNKYGQVWDTPNVFVTGAALYPQNPGANPTGTLLALAYMTGDAIRDRYFKHPNELLE